MNLVYTHRGFPALMDIQVSSGAVYEAPEISNIYRARCEQTRPGFDVELEQIRLLLAEWTRTGGFFQAALQPSVRLAGSIQSFIAETAMYLTKRITRRTICFQDRALLMKQDLEVATRLPTFTADERAALSELSSMKPEVIIQFWVTRLGVDDLSCSMQLYVGDRTIAALL
jgi:hypothetical protein